MHNSGKKLNYNNELLKLFSCLKCLTNKTKIQNTLDQSPKILIKTEKNTNTHFLLMKNNVNIYLFICTINKQNITLFIYIFLCSNQKLYHLGIKLKNRKCDYYYDQSQTFAQRSKQCVNNWSTVDMAPGGKWIIIIMAEMNAVLLKAYWHKPYQLIFNFIYIIFLIKHFFTLILMFSVSKQKNVTFQFMLFF